MKQINRTPETQTGNNYLTSPRISYDEWANMIQFTLTAKFAVRPLFPLGNTLRAMKNYRVLYRALQNGP